MYPCFMNLKYKQMLKPNFINDFIGLLDVQQKKDPGVS